MDFTGYTKMIHLLIVVLSTLTLSSLQDELSNPDRSDWVDPGDMLNYDLSSQHEKRPKMPQKEDTNSDDKVQSEETISAMPQAGQLQGHNVNSTALDNLTAQLKECENREIACQKCCEKNTDVPNERVYFEQFVRAFLRKFPAQEEGLSSFDVVVQLYNHDYLVLKNYADSKGSIQDVHSVFGKMFSVVTVQSEESKTSRTWSAKLWRNFPFIIQCVSALCLSLIAVNLLMKMRLTWVLLVRMSIFLFFISVPWVWWHLYMQKQAERHAELMKERPAECAPRDMTFLEEIWHGVSAAFSFSDPCKKYYEKLLVDPMWEVPPTMALAVTISKFIFEPLGHLGEALNKFLKATFEDLPIQLWPVMLVLVTVLVILGLIMACGYRVRLLGSIVGIEPHHRTSVPGQLQQPCFHNHTPQERITDVTNGYTGANHSLDRYSTSTSLRGKSNLQELPAPQPCPLLEDRNTTTQSEETRTEPVQEVVQTCKEPASIINGKGDIASSPMVVSDALNQPVDGLQKQLNNKSDSEEDHQTEISLSVAPESKRSSCQFGSKTTKSCCQPVDSESQTGERTNPETVQPEHLHDSTVNG